MIDMTDQYNTELSPEEEKAFQAWATEHNRAGDLYDYDMRGHFKETKGGEAAGHFPDTYKKPNHPTFSDESRYHGRDGHQGGRWGEGTFTPGRTNMELYGAGALDDYLRRIEPGVRLVVPNEQEQ